MTGPGLEADDFKKDRNILDKAHAFVDSHIRLVKVRYCAMKEEALRMIAVRDLNSDNYTLNWL